MFLKTTKPVFFLSLVMMALVCLQASTSLAAPEVDIDLEIETRNKVTLAITDFVMSDSGVDILGMMR